MINELAKEIHKNALDKGFYEKPRNVAEMLMLMVTEISEACEADRKDFYVKYHSMDAINGWVSDKDFADAYKEHVKGSFEEEMADIVIRVMDMCAFKKIDLEAHIKAKMRYNSTREKYHGKKY